MGYVVAAFYRFVHLHNYYDMRPVLLEFCLEHSIKGTVILAEQGINATVAGSLSSIEKLFSFLDLDDRLCGMKYHESYSDREPFSKMKVRLKSEVVRLGIDGFDCSSRGEYVDPQEWDGLVHSPDMHVIDTRNGYEIRFGRFRGAINPGTSSFREFPEWARNWASDKEKGIGIAMYCTGGIRCEKSTAFMKSLGFRNVYHLRGGILNYLKTVRGGDSLWEGECFVFDDRIAVDRNMVPTEDTKCVECMEKVDAGDIRSISKGHILCRSCKSRA
ncbi:oxygen-dependent tRNA uridine(34) hydroxylase TrhO [Anaplasma capra]|uniref:oxygen-dependent tRNA uridine(34) hydroxylase TrhO n=1 Tax=Anaplasma capra TaxID=1562740 RepID=UPI0021D5A1AE|nr:rhodanese-related sulfurtransferase [Anaplasma capra]MCU7611370.1 rhodanese-related sulfurtransferase [Anaplasma capra]MCU7612444.1 rhodanese-related sulfurtransferase [Anaplasma capra]